VGVVRRSGSSALAGVGVGVTAKVVIGFGKHVKGKHDREAGSTLFQGERA